MTGNPERLHLEDPLEISEARRAARRMSIVRRVAENAHEEAVAKAADECERSLLKSLIDWSRTVWERENPPGLRTAA